MECDEAMLRNEAAHRNINVLQTEQRQFLYAPLAPFVPYLVPNTEINSLQ